MTKDTLRSATLPNPTLVLFLMAGVLIWYFCGEDTGPLSALAAALVMTVLAACVIYAISRRPWLAVIFLVAGGTMARVYVEIFGLKARPEHFAIVLFCLALPFWQRRQLASPRWILPDLFLVLYVASNLLSSLVMSIAPAKTIRWAMQQTLVILAYFLLRIFCTSQERFRKCFMILLAVGAGQAMVAIFCFLSNLIFGTGFGMEIGQYGSIPGTYGLELEANILGSISAAAFVMMIIMYLKERRSIFLWGMAITYAGVLVALARAAVMGAFVAFGLLIIISVRNKLIDMPSVKKLAKTLIITSVIFFPMVISLYLQRFSTLDVTDVSADEDTTTRVITLVTAMDGVMEHPILGNGTASFQLLVSMQDLGFGDDVDQNAWIGNTEMRVLHDTGIVGLTLLLCFLGSLAVKAIKILRLELKPELLALLLACVVYSVTFQATEGTLLEFFWVHAGLLGCAVSIYGVPKRQLADSGGHRVSLGPASA
ncbi:MAG TPA: O-antigen ligase family protein [Candidatus Angelobacter sp.]|nr:O-antigen ligase family protein [Candidatus Angelobacter sp.]